MLLLLKKSISAWFNKQIFFVYYIDTKIEIFYLNCACVLCEIFMHTLCNSKRTNHTIRFYTRGNIILFRVAIYFLFCWFVSNKILLSNCISEKVVFHNVVYIEVVILDLSIVLDISLFVGFKLVKCRMQFVQQLFIKHLKQSNLIFFCTNILSSHILTICEF